LTIYFTLVKLVTMKSLKNVTIETDSLLTITEAAKILGVTRMTIYRWINKGKIRSVSFGTINYIPRQDVEEKKSEQE